MFGHRPPLSLRPLAVTAGAALALLLTCGPAGAAQDAGPEPANIGAVWVNAQLIGLREVEALFEDLLPLVEDRLKHGLLPPDQRNNAVRAAWKEAVQTAIQDALLDQMGRQRREQIIRSWVRSADPDAPPSRMMDSFRRLEEDEVRRLRRQKVEEAGGEAELRAALKRKNMRLEDWEAGLRQELFRMLVLNQGLSPSFPSPAAARAYYEAHPETFRTQAAWRLRRIRILKKDYASAAAAAQAAALIHQKLTEGLDFGQVAVLQDDPPYSAQGGVLSVDNCADVPAGSFPLEERIAAGLKDGEFSAPVDLGAALLIVKREQHRPAQLTPFEAAQKRAESLAYAETVMQKKQAFFDREKARNYIEILCPEPPAKYLK